MKELVISHIVNVADMYDAADVEINMAILIVSNIFEWDEKTREIIKQRAFVRLKDRKETRARIKEKNGYKF